LGPAAGVAEAVVDGELDDVVLLHGEAVEDLAADAEAELEALGVGLREDELRGGDRGAEAGDLAVHAAEEDLHELGRLRGGAEPGPRGLEVGGARRAVHHGGVARYTLRDVDARAEAARARVGRAAFGGMATPQVQQMDVHAAEACGWAGRSIAPPDSEGRCGDGSIVVGCCCVDRRGWLVGSLTKLTRVSFGSGLCWVGRPIF